MTYTISATIPAMSDGYKKRYFKIKDKMTGRPYADRRE